MMYHPIKFGCKKISSSADTAKTVTFDQMSPHCDWTWRQQTNLLARHSGPWWCITIPSLVTEGSADEEISSRWTFWTFSVTLILTTTEQSNLFTRQSTLWWCTVQPSSVAKGSAAPKKYIKKSYFDYIIFDCDLELGDGKPILLKDNLAHNYASPYQAW